MSVEVAPLSVITSVIELVCVLKIVVVAVAAFRVTAPLIKWVSVVVKSVVPPFSVVVMILTMEVIVENWVVVESLAVFSTVEGDRSVVVTVAGLPVAVIVIVAYCVDVACIAAATAR